MILLLSYTEMISWLEQRQVPCLFKKAFHLDCPGCGMQRSGIALLRGDITGSLQLYPALLLILVFFIYLAADKKFHFRFSTKITQLGIACIFITILVSYIFKLTS